MAGKDRKILILVGLSGSGKSEAGRRLAERLGVEFVELDGLIEQRMNMTIPEIFEELGEDVFREEEHKALVSLAGCGSCIVATGGGVVERLDNMDILKSLGTIVWLRVDPEIAIKRFDPNTRPLLAGTPDPLKALRGMAKRRDPLYEKICDYQIDAGQNVERVTDELQHIWDSL